jgi:hypothetical protein
MLLARLPIATRYPYAVQFYHGANTPYVRALRATFVGELRAAAPRFVIQVDEDKPWVLGRGTSRRFKALEQLLAESYRVALAKVYERRAGGGPARGTRPRGIPGGGRDPGPRREPAPHRGPSP